MRVKVKVTGSRIVIGSPEKYIASVCIFTMQALPCELVHECQAA